ncbi:recombinase family protein [Kallotenue papyrolyticum]|uniref:recombinase family protein n=1 Tax=Kallotenue papyrolyticum TaxID=1325125 RepID=UPI0004785EEE|nr:recombinase family protein [Kallotenue papyrolyticum]
MTSKHRIQTPKNAPTPPPETAAIYLRVSTEEQADEGFGLDVQRTQTSAYATAFGLTLVGEYADEGVSGTKGIGERPQLAAAIQAAKAGHYKTLIVPAIDRLARRVSLLLQIWDELEAAGVTIVLVKERIDTSTAVGRLMRTVIAAIAEFERDNIVARTTDGRNARGKLDGEKGGRVPYGYVRNGSIEIEPTKAAVVRRIFALHRRRFSLAEICAQLNEDRVPTPQGGVTWYPATLRIILKNKPIYLGGKRGESEVCWPAIL